MALGGKGGHVRDDAVAEAQAIDTYFKEHKLEDFLVEMLMDIGKRAPADPYDYMLDYVSRRQYNGASDGAKVVRRGSKDQRASFFQRRPSREEIAMHRLSMAVGAESQSVQSFVKEWAQPDSLSVLSEDDNSEDAVAELGCAKVVSQREREQAELSFVNVAASDGELDRLLSWEFDVLETPDEKLMANVFTIFDLWGLVGAFKLPAKSLQHFILSVRENYNSKCHYHNYKHGYSVLIATANLVRYGFHSFFNQLEVLGNLIAAYTHDVGHEGFNNDYYVKAQHDLAIRYNDQAVLESMHAALTFEILRLEGNGFHEVLSVEDFQTLRRGIIAAILATDLKVHFELTTKLQDMHGQEGVQDDKAARELVQKVLVHAADISNPLLPRGMYKKWSYRVVMEFHEQAETEKRKGLPFAPFMEPHPDNLAELAKLQIGFISFVVEPFWSAVAGLSPEVLAPRLAQLTSNKEYWVRVKERLEADPNDLASEDEEEVTR